MVWGPKMWYILHNFSMFLPNKITDRVANHYKFIRAMPFLIPCNQCRNHCCDLISTYTDSELFKLCKSRNTSKTFFVKLHNHEYKLNKPTFKLEQLKYNIENNYFNITIDLLPTI